MKYVAQIDGVRCFAILSVMVAHWISWDVQNEFIRTFPWNHGVVLFFVLSGYLITSILLQLREETETQQLTYGKALRNFYIRRTLRIFPVYYLTIFFLYHINYTNVQQLFPWLVTYTSNIYQGKVNEYVGSFNHFWSLAIEEQFYLVWPSLILFIPRKYLLRLMVICMALSFGCRLFMWFYYREHWMMIAYFTLNLLLPLALGGVLAYFRRYRYEEFRKYFAKPLLMYITGGVYLLLFLFVKSDFYRAICDEYVFSFFAATVVARAADANFRFAGKWILENKIVVYLGLISYGLYVFHLFMGDFFWNWVVHNIHLQTDLKYTMWALYFVCCVILATLSYYLIEKPITSLKRFFPY